MGLYLEEMSYLEHYGYILPIFKLCVCLYKEPFICLCNSLINFSPDLFLLCFMLYLRQGPIKPEAHSVVMILISWCLPLGSGIISSNLFETRPSEHFIEITSDKVTKWSCILLVYQSVFTTAYQWRLLLICRF